MSNLQREHGSIQLPRGGAARLREALRPVAEAHAQRLRSEIDAVWPGIKPLSNWDRVRVLNDGRSFPNLSQEARSLLYEPGHEIRVRKPSADKVRRSVASYGMPVPMPDGTWARRTVYSLGHGGQVVLDGDVVRWRIEGNRAVDASRKTPVLQALLRFLGSARWTPGTGGEISGWDESDSRNLDIGERDVAEYGPGKPGFLG